MRISLASMPWSIFNRPSIQLGSLKSYLSSQDPGISVRNFHPYLEVAHLIGFDIYHQISESNWAGESLYSALLFPEQRNRAAEVFLKCLKGNRDKSSTLFDSLVSKLEQHLAGWVQKETLVDAELLGFSICFSQLLPSLYAAKVIKQRHPHLKIVFGGSSCTPVLSKSLLKVFPMVDFIVTGEGEMGLLQLCQYIGGTGPFPQPNVLGNPGHKRPKNTLPSATRDADLELNDLDTLAAPDYEDYFEELNQNKLDFIPTLPLEFSRGCWWNKCSFCNLNLQWLGYRHKSGKKMLQEYASLKKRYRCLDFSFTDNALPGKEAELFFSSIAASDDDPNFFAEIRSLQRPDSYHKYRRGGLKTVQVGIEALSDSLLKKMNKGVRTIENIAALKYAMAADISLEGNLILEFPGSTSQEVAETLEALEFVLPFKPLKAASFFLGQGSPIFCAPGSYGIKAIVQHPYNKKLFPADYLSQLELLIQAYRGDRQRQIKLWRPIHQKIASWQAFHQQRVSQNQPALSYRQGDDFLIIRQETGQGAPLHHRLRGTSKNIYLACQEIVSKKELLHRFNWIKEYQLLTFLEELKGKKLLFFDDKFVLALAFRNVH